MADRTTSRAADGWVTNSAADTAKLKLARERFAQASAADDKQRRREIEDLKFYAGDQWDDAQRTARAGQNASNGMPPVPARPCLTINKVRQPVQQVTNDIRESDFGFELVAADDFGDLAGASDDTEVELREGLARRIQRSSEADDARLWAAIRAAICGRGYYGVLTRFVTGKSFDQEIYVHRYYNQSSVTLDPAHEQPDGSDAEWGFVGVDMPWDQYKAEFPKNAKRQKNAIVSATAEEFRAIGDDFPDWFSMDGETRSCRVVDYWYTERETRTLVQLTDGSVWWEDELPEGTPETVIVNEREVIEKKIKWCKIDGVQVLDETDWPGPDLPIVKVLGEELQPYDRERRAEGMVRPARDAQMGFNSMISKWVETVGLAPIPPFQATMEQIEGYEPWYQLANTRTLPYLPYNRVDDASGESLGKPERTPVDTPIQAIAASVQMFDEAIQSTTGVPDSRVGRNTDPNLKSGKAILALEQQSKQGTSNYRDNLKRSVRYEAQIINNLLYPIYGQPGRIVKIMTGEGDSQTVRVATDGAAMPTAPVGMMNTTPGLKEMRLTPNANYNIIAKVTRAFDSRREEESTIIGNLLNANPMFMTWFGDLFFKNQDGPGHQEMAKRAKVMLDPKIQQMLAQDQQGGAVPPEVQQAMAAKDQQIQHAEAAMRQMAGELQSKKLEQETKLKIAQMDGQRDIELQKMKDATSIEVAMIAARAKGVLSVHEAQDEAIALHQEQLGDAALSAQEHAQGLEAQRATQQHQAAMAAAGAGAADESAAAQREHEATQSQAQLDAAAESAQTTE